MQSTVQLRKKEFSIPLWSDFILINKLPEDIIKKYFQSHFGLILSSLMFIESPRPGCFQSHFGLILSVLHGLRVFHSMIDLSIPFWSDFIWRCRTDGESRRHILSIPFWSDFIDDVLLYEITELAFQSHFGLILSLHFVPKQYISKAFQSHFGLILSQSGFFYISQNFSLSIPFWSDFIILFPVLSTP